MTLNQVKSFRDVLGMRLKELQSTAIRGEAIRIESVPDELDRTQGACEREMAVRNLETASAALRAVRAALRRIDEGCYGYCLDCGEEISQRRLTAMPTAALCIICQEAADRVDNHPARGGRLPIAA